MDIVAGQQPQKSPSLLHTAGTPQSHLSLGLNSNMTVTSKTKLLIIHNLCSQVASERNDREQFLRSGVNPGYGGVRQNGTYSSHPNLPTFDPLTHPSQLSAFPPIEPPALPKMAPLPRPPVRQPAKNSIVPLVLQAAQGGSHRKLPALPKQPSSLKLQTWRQVGQEILKCLSEVFLLPELAAGETEPARAGFRRFKREPHGELDHHFRHCSDPQGHRNC